MDRIADGSTEVLLVGAGPTGLLLAAELARRDVPCLLIDALDAPRGWDRATVVYERSLEIFEALGIADRLIAEGVRTRGARFHSDGQTIAELILDLPGARYGFQLGVSEEVTESVLTDYLEAHGGGVTRSSRLVDLKPGADSVTATIEHDGGRREVVAPWLVGCDGYHSLVREAVGIDFPGSDIPAPWAVFDASLEGFNDDHDLVSVHLDQPPVILTPLPRRTWRAYVRPMSEASDLVAEAEQAPLRAGSQVHRCREAEYVSLSLAGCRHVSVWACSARRRRRPRLHAGGRTRDEYRPSRRLQPRLEAGPRVSRGGRCGPARHL